MRIFVIYKSGPSDRHIVSLILVASIKRTKTGLIIYKNKFPLLILFSTIYRTILIFLRPSSLYNYRIRKQRRPFNFRRICKIIVGSQIF